MLNSLSSIEENKDEFHNSFKSSKSSNSPLSEKNSSIFVYENFSFQENQNHKLQDSYEILKNMHGCNEDYNIKINKQKPQQQLQYQQQQKQNRFLQFEQQEDDVEETINFQFLKNQQQQKFNKKSKSNKQNNFQQMLHLNDNEQEHDEELQQILDNFFEAKNCQYCKKKMNQKILNAHEEQCIYRETNYDEIQCPYCGDNIVRAFINDHFEECVMYIEDKFSKLEGVLDCSICMNEINDNKLILKCQHYFHSDCIKDWLKKKNECPVCREQILNQIH